MHCIIGLSIPFRNLSVADLKTARVNILRRIHSFRSKKVERIMRNAYRVDHHFLLVSLLFFYVLLTSKHMGSCTLSCSVSNRIPVLLLGELRRAEANAMRYVCVWPPFDLRRRRRAQKSPGQQSVGMASSSLGPTRRCNRSALLLTSLTDFANKIGDQRPPAGVVRPQADHYPKLSRFI